MSERIRLVIEADAESGAVNVTGQIDNMVMMHWLLGETRRIVERRADERDRVRANGGLIKPEMVLHLPQKG